MLIYKRILVEIWICRQARVKLNLADAFIQSGLQTRNLAVLMFTARETKRDPGECTLRWRHVILKNYKLPPDIAEFALRSFLRSQKSPHALTMVGGGVILEETTPVGMEKKFNHKIKVSGTLDRFAALLLCNRDKSSHVHYKSIWHTAALMDQQTRAGACYRIQRRAIMMWF